MSPRLEQELHAMTSAEEHILARWLLDHHPAVFAQGAAIVRKIRAADERKIRATRELRFLPGLKAGVSTKGIR